jgi:hypothetical protein
VDLTDDMPPCLDMTVCILGTVCVMSDHQMCNAPQWAEVSEFLTMAMHVQQVEHGLMRRQTCQPLHCVAGYDSHRVVL